MKLTTIWTLPAATLAEKLRRTADWAAFTTAANLPARVSYWAFIMVGTKAMPENAIVPEARFMDLLQNAEGGPK